MVEGFLVVDERVLEKKLQVERLGVVPVLLKILLIPSFLSVYGVLTELREIFLGLCSHSSSDFGLPYLKNQLVVSIRGVSPLGTAAMRAR